MARKRNDDKPNHSKSLIDDPVDDDDDKLKFYRPMPTSHFLGVLALILFVFAAVIFIEKQLPTPLRVEDELNNPDRFIAQRAYENLRKLTDIGPRTAGSAANEELAVKVLKNTIQKIIKNRKSHHKIELDVQKASGAFNLEFLDGMTNVYRDIQNVVVKVGSEIKSPHSLLINCHFDSVVDSPGNGVGLGEIISNLYLDFQAPATMEQGVLSC